MSHERPFGRIALVLIAAILPWLPLLPLFDPLNSFLYATYAVPGVVLAVKRPQNVIGWLLIAVALGYLYTATSPTTFDPVAIAAGRAAPLDVALLWVQGWSAGAMLEALFALIIVFPTGRLPADRWRGPALVVVVAMTVLIVLGAFAPTLQVSVSPTVEITIPNPGAILPDAPIWPTIQSGPGLPIMVGILVAAAVSLVVRYRAATGVVRLQLRWLVAASAFVALALCGYMAAAATRSEALASIAWVPVLIALLSLPIAVAVAVLRYRLLEIDRIISRTIAYVVITTALVAAYAGLVIVIGGPLAGVTGGDTISVALSTLVVAALFQPLRQRVQTIVDRRFDRARFDADRTTAGFSERLRYEVDIVAVGDDLQATVQAAIKPVRLGLWLRQATDR